MTSFQYDGAQYDAAQWDADPATAPYWVLAGERLRVISATLTPTTLDLEVRVRDASDRAVLDTLDDNAGALDERERADGTTEGLDDAGGSNTFNVRPPMRLRPPRVEREWLVDDVSRDRASADGKSTLASISLVAKGTRPPVEGHADASNADQYEFAFQGGTIVTPAVEAVQQGASTVVQMTLTRHQAELFETVTAAAAGAVVNAVPDGSSFTRDTTPNSRQTVDITTPANASDPPLSDGDHVVEEWTVSGLGGGFRVEMEISGRYEA